MIFTNYFLMMTLDRFLRTLNLTGDKWSHLPDLGDWLSRPDNKFFLISAMAMSLLIVVVFLSFDRLMANVTLVMFVVANFSYRVLSCFGFTSASLDPLIRICYCIIFEQFIIYLYHRCPKKLRIFDSSVYLSNYLISKESTELSNVLMLLMSLLCRPHNLILVAGFILKKSLLRRIRICDNRPFRIPDQVIIFHMLGMVAFYQQGNSHSLATIDLQTGYTGLSSYQPVTVAVLLTAHTWFGYLSWTVVMLEWLSVDRGAQAGARRGAPRSAVAIEALSLINSCLCLSLMTVCSLLKHHLFVWSVFTPRLMYCCFYSLIIVPLTAFMMKIYV